MSVQVRWPASVAADAKGQPVARDESAPGDDARPAAERWGADDAVTRLYTAHYAGLVRLSVLLVRDVSTAEEVVQDAFVAMHRSWRRLRDTDKALAYLRRSVVNGSRSRLRHRGVTEKYLARQAAPSTTESAERGALDRLDYAEVVTALRRLPDRQREALVLRYYGDLSEADIAAAMGISRGAVKSHASRGMSALRTSLEQIA